MNTFHAVNLSSINFQFECHWVNVNTVEIFNTVYSFYYKVLHLYGEYYPCRDSQVDVAMCPGDKRPLFHGYKKKVSDPKTNLKHDCFIEFVNITVYEIFFFFVQLRGLKMFAASSLKIRPCSECFHNSTGSQKLP